MIPLRIKGANMLMTSEEPGVGDLHVLRGVVAGYTSYTSRWEPTPAELAILNAGGSVELSCLHAQVPVKLSAAPRSVG